MISGESELGKVDQNAIAAFAFELSQATKRLPMSALAAQVDAAEIIANKLRAHLLGGVPPELSPMSIAIRGERGPLERLAKHVVVTKPKGMQVRWPKGKTIRGVKVGGRFTSSFNPAVVGWEQGFVWDEITWEEVAWKLENGFMWQVSENERRHAFGLATEGGFVYESGFHTGGVWDIPARPFFEEALGDDHTQAIVEKVTELLLEDEIDKLSALRKASTPAERTEHDKASDLDSGKKADFDNETYQHADKNAWDWDRFIDAGGMDEEDFDIESYLANR